MTLNYLKNPNWLSVTDTMVKANSDYQGIQHLHENSDLPIKCSKNKPLTKHDKQANK